MVRTRKELLRGHKVAAIGSSAAVLGASPSQEQEIRESPWRYAHELERVMYETKPPVKNDYKHRVLHEKTY